MWYRPPLARELFVDTPHFRAASERYYRLQPLIPLLEANEWVEETLENIQLEAGHDVERRRQLLAIRYYLRSVIHTCQAAWQRRTRGVSNYATLLDQIRRLPGVCFVTFNYDTMLENALEKIDLPHRTVDQYISNPKYKLFKLHGSIDWRVWIPKAGAPALAAFNEQPDEQTLIHAAPSVGECFRIAKEGCKPSFPEMEQWFHLPALAIPTTSKHTFVCPPEHVEALRNLIPEVTKIAIVGWRAGERHFLRLLKAGLKRPVPVIAACGDIEARDETYKRIMEAGIPAQVSSAVLGGFTDFVVNRSIVPFIA